MVPFRIVPKISIYQSYAEFASAFHIGKEDLIITNEYIYNAGMKEVAYTGNVLFQERFGSGEPSNVMMDQIFQAARKHPYQRVIGVGGGTVIDIAKLLAIGGNGVTTDYFNGLLPVVKDKELILIPTTCGTGSEMTNISILEIKEQHTKKGLAVDALYGDHAVLIPQLLQSLPFRFFATSSIDALIHGAESFVSPGSTRITEVFSTKAMEIIIHGYREIAEYGPEERHKRIGDFLLASTYAGIAFGNTGVGAVHAMSYPLGAVYHVPHGEANQQLFTEVFKTYKQVKPVGKIEELEQLLSKFLEVPLPMVWDELDHLLEKILPRKLLQEYGMQQEETQSFADSVLENQQRLLKNNYVPFSRTEMIEIYNKLY